MSSVLAPLFFALSFGAARGSFFDTNLLELFHGEIGKLQGNESRCLQDLKRYVDGLKKSEQWAMEMYDSSSKVPVSLLMGNLNYLGSFDECLAIKDNNRISGQHCMVRIHTPKFHFGNFMEMTGDRGKKSVQEILEYKPIGWSVCTPDSCRAEDLQNVFDRISSKVDFNVTFIENRCQNKSKEKPLNAAAWGTLVFFIFVLILVVLSTIYDLWLHTKHKKTSYPIFLAFSGYTNGKKIISTSKNPDQLPCIHGIKAISMFWIILFHICSVFYKQPVMNLRSFLLWKYESWFSSLLLGGHVAVDTFLSISAILLVYGFMKGVERKESFNIPLFYLHRYLRITPALLVLVLISISLLPYIGSGPFWPEIYDALQTPCRRKWWAALLYIHNYITHEFVVCVPHSWYLALDMQLFVLSPILLIPLKKWPNMTLAMIGLLITISIAVPFYFAWTYQLKGIFFTDLSDYMSQYYLPTYCRFGTWLIGFVTGYIIFKMRNRKVDINKHLVIALWLASIAIMLMSLLGGYTTLQHDYNRLESALFVTLSRISWSVGLCWMIFACLHGYGWIVNRILCLPVFQIVSNLSYSTYLTHFYIQRFNSYSARTANNFNEIKIFHQFWGDLFFALFFAVILCLGFELPMITFDRILFRNFRHFGNPIRKGRENSANS